MTAAVFALVESDLAARGFVRSEDVEAESFGSRYRTYTRGAEGVRLVFDGRDRSYVLEGGVPWRNLASRRPAAGESAATTAAALLAPLGGAG